MCGEGRAGLRKLRIALGTLVLLYIVACGALYLAMRQPPARFGALMANVPRPVMMILPFRPLWMAARAGDLGAGSPAPDFELPTLDRRRTVRLSEEWRQRPVVLIFGSYT
jgi:hypothetical protein